MKSTTPYPTCWRDRYGDEFAAALEERPLGPFDVADVLLGVLDAPLLGVAGMLVTGDSDAPLVGGMDGWMISTFGLLTLLVGSGLFAIATWRTRALSRGAAELLGIGSLVVVPVLTGIVGGLMPDFLLLPALAAAILAFPLGWMALGVSALRVRPVSVTLEGASL